MKNIIWLLFTLILISGQAIASKKQIELIYGVDDLGYATNDWIQFDANNSLINHKTSQREAKKLSIEETEWVNLIATRLTIWETQFTQIALPFTKTEIPSNISIVVGNMGSLDAFAYTTKFPAKIFFNVKVFANSYGSAKDLKNQNRIDRIFAHEFTHLLQHRWSQKNPYPMTSPLDRALTASYKEGFGHFRSISNKWKDEQGQITARAEKTLISLETEFVARMIALHKSSDEEAKNLMKGLSMGPFHKKWGALTVALWLTKESNGDDKKLIKWVNMGPKGIISLANKYLPETLRITLNNALNNHQH